MKSPNEWLDGIITDHDLDETVRTALEHDRSIGQVGSVDVHVEDGIVTITGTVYSLAQKWAVEHAAQRGAGTAPVINDLRIDPPKTVFHTDQEIANAAATLLRATVGAPDGIDVAVLDGRMTLNGTVASPGERLAAANAVASLVGVTALDNRIVIAPTDRIIQY